ncbi:MAG: FxsA family protein [Pseudomonadota bacterium]
MWLFIPFVLVPIIEIALFIQVGGAIGLWPTLGIVVLTALAGTLLMRAQGLATLARVQDSLRQGGDPTGPLVHAAMILVAGVLLLTPGFFTDACGFALLLPPVRSMLIKWGKARFAKHIVVASAGRPFQEGTGSGDTIDGSFEAVDPDDIVDPETKPGQSGWTRPL